MENELSKRFDMKYLVEAKLCLGIEIHRDLSIRKLRLFQIKDLNGFLEIFSISDSLPVDKPIEHTFLLGFRFSWQKLNVR